MKQTGIIRAVKLAPVQKSLFLRLYSVDETGRETLVATSAPIAKVAAAAICRLFEPPLAVKPDVDMLKRLFDIYGKTEWAGFTAQDASEAALQACMQHDMSRAQGILLIVTLSMHCNIVDTVKRALAVVHQQAPVGIETGLLVAYDESLEDRVRVEMLLVGM